MVKRRLLWTVLLLSILVSAEVYSSDNDENSLSGYLEDKGIEFAASTTHIYQSNVKGGLSTHNHRGRYSGRYDIELTFDGQKIFGRQYLRCKCERLWKQVFGYRRVLVSAGLCRQ